MASRKRCPVVLAAAVLAAVAAAPAQGATEPETRRVSVSTNGIQSAGGDVTEVVISADGRFVAFTSGATNLVPGDTNAAPDIFVRELATGVTTLASVNSAGAPGNAASGGPAISADGRFVAFHSYADNLVPGDTNTVPDVFLHDRQSGQTTRVSVTSAGDQATSPGGSAYPAVSGDGRIVAFVSGSTNLVAGDTNGAPDVFVHDRSTGETNRVSLGPAAVQANGGSGLPGALAISADGRFVAFASAATNLVSGDGNGKTDIFVNDLVTGQTRRVSVGPGGAEPNGDSSWPSISADGSAVAYESLASNLVPGDTNGHADIFVTRSAGAARMSLGPGGVQGNGDSDFPRISADGLSVVFTSAASNLVPHDTNGSVDVFLVRGGKAVRTNLGPAGAEADNHSFICSISAKGIVAFASAATNLVDDDTNGLLDAFVSVLRSTHEGFQLFPS